MAERTGKCTNYTTCTLAYRNQPVTVSGEFVCPECGKPLQDNAPTKKAAGFAMPKKPVLIGAGGAAALVIVCGIALSQCGEKPSSKAPEIAGTEPVPNVEPATPPPVSATPEPIVEKPPLVATTTPVQMATPAPEPPAGPVEAPAKIDVDLGSKENREVRQEVLNRIDKMPNLSDRERDALYNHVERAKTMGKLITIPFDAGKSVLSPAAIAQLQGVLRAPEVAARTADPNVVFVILGFADKSGDPKKNQQVSEDRAESVVKTLREKCGVQSLMHSIGMGGSDFFEKGERVRNRVAEVWAVLP